MSCLYLLVFSCWECSTPTVSSWAGVSRHRPHAQGGHHVHHHQAGTSSAIGYTGRAPHRGRLGEADPLHGWPLLRREPEPTRNAVAVDGLQLSVPRLRSTSALPASPRTYVSLGLDKGNSGTTPTGTPREYRVCRLPRNRDRARHDREESALLVVHQRDVLSVSRDRHRARYCCLNDEERAQCPPQTPGVCGWTPVGRFYTRSPTTSHRSEALLSEGRHDRLRQVMPPARG